LIATVLVPLIGNGLRCVGIILLAHFTNNEYGAGADHIVYGWGFNLAILLFLIVIGAFFRDEMHEELPTYQNKWVSDRPAHVAAVTALAAILISTGPAFAWWRDTRHALPDMAPIANYLQTAGWQQESVSGNWSPHYPGADARLGMSSSAAPGPAIDLFIGYYARPRAGHSMTAHLNEAWDRRVWNRTRTALVKGPAELGRPEIQETVISSGPLKRLVWSVFWVDGSFTRRPLTVKLLQARATFHGREGQAVIALSTPVNGPIEDARSRLALALSGLGQLPDVLDRANAPAHEGGR
jgi:EpsI family protein